MAAVAITSGCGGDSSVTSSTSDSPASTTPVATTVGAGVSACKVDTPDGVALAVGLLSQASNDPSIPQDQLDGLSQEIERVLERVRGANPATKEIHAQPDYSLAEILVGLDPELLAPFRRTDRHEGDAGHSEFDKLNTELGLADWRVPEDDDFAELCFSKQINVPAAAAAYGGIDGVRYAIRIDYGYPPEEIPDDIEVSKDGDTWYVVIRKGSSYAVSTSPPTVYFFAVSGDSVTKIPRSEAASSSVFARLVRACAKEPCELN